MFTANYPFTLKFEQNTPLNQQKKSCNPITKESSRPVSFANYVLKWCCGDGLLLWAVAMAQPDILQQAGRPHGHARKGCYAGRPLIKMAS